MDLSRKNERSVSEPQPDAALVAAARRGDKKAFVEIVARHQAMVCGIAFGILSDFAASEDAAQEAFLTAWRRIHDLREPAKLRAWLGQIARHAALGYLRKRRGLDPLEEEAFEKADEAPLPHEAVCQEEEAELVRASLQQLSETYRFPLILYYRDGQSVRAVAEALEISEDAVKQRLARGREMLRDQMSGVLERVLTKTGPTPIFTMTIAGLIGALAAPAAIAGTVFAASAATAAASTSTTTVSSLITSMSTSKPLLVTAALVGALCIPVGYHLGHDSNSRPQTSEVSDAAQKAATAKLTYEDTFIFAEWRSLHDLHGTDSAAMPKLYKAIADLKDPFKRRAFRAALISEWVQVDPRGGIAFFMNESGPDGVQRQQFFQEWLAVDPQNAITSLVNGGTNWHRVARECLSDIATKAPEQLVGIVDKLPKVSDNFWDTRVRDAFATLAEKNLISAKEAVERLTGPNREEALAGIAKVWGKGDIEGAINWAKTLPEGIDRNEIIRTALLGKAAIDPIAALNSINIVPPGGRESYFASSTGARVLREAIKADYDGTIAWLAANPGKLGRHDIEGIAEEVTKRINQDPAGFLNSQLENKSLMALYPAIESALLNRSSGKLNDVWDWLKQQPDNTNIQNLREMTLRTISWKSPEAALKLMAEIPDNTSNQSLLASIASSMAASASNGGGLSARLGELINKAPDKVKGMLTASAFETMNWNSLDNPSQWVARIADVPEEKRLSSTVNLARAWAQTSPTDAANWVSSFPPGEGRSMAITAVAGSWAASDVAGAANWLSTLPQNTDRDRGVSSLVNSLAGNHPAEALQWASSISDERIRRGSTTVALGSLAQRDIAMARQWIEQSNFSPQVKAEMHSQIANPQKLSQPFHVFP